jgi:outer membrane protein assembly factor BamD
MMRHRNRVAMATLVLAATLLLTGCRSAAAREDPILRLSAAESLAIGKEHMESRRYFQARKYLAHAFEVEPNSVSGREALLLVADSLYLQGGTQNLIQAEAKYRDFLNRFPTSDRAAYVQFQIGNTLAKRVGRPDRDQSVTRQALGAYEELLRVYPASEHRQEVEAKRDEMLSLLAEHEFLVGYFYLRYGLPQAAIGRFEHVTTSYPRYSEMDKVYFHLGMAKNRLGDKEEARQWFERLREEYPESPLVTSIPTAAARQG